MVVVPKDALSFARCPRMSGRCAPTPECVTSPHGDDDMVHSGWQIHDILQELIHWSDCAAAPRSCLGVDIDSCRLKMGICRLRRGEACGCVVTLGTQVIQINEQFHCNIRAMLKLIRCSTPRYPRAEKLDVWYEGSELVNGRDWLAGRSVHTMVYGIY